MPPDSTIAEVDHVVTTPLAVRLRYDFQYATVCAQTAQAAVTQFVFGQAPQGVGTMPPTFVAPGQRYLAPLTPPPCEWALVTYSQSDTTVAMAILQ